MRSIVTRAKYWVKVLLGMKLYIPRQVRTKTVFFGTEYGGYTIQPLSAPTMENSGRSDSSGDRLIVYSVGIGEDVSFDEGILDAYPQARVYAFDPTPKAIRYLEKHPLSKDSRFTFLPCGMSDACGTETFYLPKNKNYVSGSVVEWDGVDGQDKLDVEMRTMGSLMEQFGHKRVDILKLDIEGSEFRVIPQILEAGCEFSQLCMEHHLRFFPDGKEKMRELIKLLNQHGYYIADVADTGEVLLFVKAEHAARPR